MIRQSILAAIGSALLAMPVSAQSASPAAVVLDSGTRIRVTVASTLHSVTGVIVATRFDSLVVRPDGSGSMMAVPLAQVLRLEVSTGERTTTRRGAVVGLGWGALAGLIVGGVTYRKPDCTGSFICIDLGPGPDMVVGAGIGGLAGLAVGALIGSRAKEIWKPAAGALGGSIGLGAVSSSRGIALVASREF
jgi:hypothetical protein